jgi:hypothetical protein
VTALGAAPRTAAAWLALIGQARDRASHFVAYDLSVQALAAWPDSLAIEHRAILALASAGALGGALARYHALEQAGRLDDLPDHLAGEFTGLGGRLFKDLAARAGGEAALAHRLKSAQTYEAGFHRLGTYYLAINAAAMYLAAGHAERAADYAAIAHDRAVRQGPDYWSLVTVAEAALILRNPDAAAAALRQAAGLGRQARRSRHHPPAAHLGRATDQHPGGGPRPFAETARVCLGFGPRRPARPTVRYGDFRVRTAPRRCRPCLRPGPAGGRRRRGQSGAALRTGGIPPRPAGPGGNTARGPRP